MKDFDKDDEKKKEEKPKKVRSKTHPNKLFF